MAYSNDFPGAVVEKNMTQLLSWNQKDVWSRSDVVYKLVTILDIN